MKKLLMLLGVVLSLGSCQPTTEKTTNKPTEKTTDQTIEKWKVADLEAAIKNADKPTVFNFWATFCKPCLEEIPYFQELAEKYEKEGVRLILVNLDVPAAYPQKIADFASKRNITATIKFLDESDADVFCPAVDESWSGSIPSTLLINHKTGYRKFYEEQISEGEFEKQLQAMISAR